jgi:hypothetical protein
MKKKYNALMEHYLVPAVLILLNVCLAHVIYAFAGSSAYTLTGRLALAVAFVLLVISLSLKKQALLGGSILFYALVVLWV